MQKLAGDRPTEGIVHTSENGSGGPAIEGTCKIMLGVVSASGLPVPAILVSAGASPEVWPSAYPPSIGLTRGRISAKFYFEKVKFILKGCTSRVSLNPPRKKDPSICEALGAEPPYPGFFITQNSFIANSGKSEDFLSL
jgi:hypothetical protein